MHVHVDLCFEIYTVTVFSHVLYVKLAQYWHVAPVFSVIFEAGGGGIYKNITFLASLNFLDKPHPSFPGKKGILQLSGKPCFCKIQGSRCFLRKLGCIFPLAFLYSNIILIAIFILLIMPDV